MTAPIELTSPDSDLTDIHETVRNRYAEAAQIGRAHV